MVSMPDEMIAKIERLSKLESRSKSELLREAVRCYDRMREQNQGMTLEESKARKLSRETEKLAEEIGQSAGSWNAVVEIRRLRNSR